MGILGQGVMVMWMSLSVQPSSTDPQWGVACNPTFEKRGVGQQAVQVSSEAGGARLSSTSASCSVTNLFCELGQVIDSSEAHLPGFPASLKMEEAGD